MKRTIIDEVKDRGIKKVRVNTIDTEKKVILGCLKPIKNSLTLSKDDKPFIFDVTYPESIKKDKEMI